jgi:hypothetical protein
VIYFWSILIKSETFSFACDDFFKTADLSGIDGKFKLRAVGSSVPL